MADHPVTGAGVLLAKLKTTERLGAASRADLEPLREPVPGARGFALDGSPQWFRVQAEPDASPWDQAHARLADCSEAQVRALLQESVRRHFGDA